MSTSKAGDRKSASFTLEEFEKQWKELTQSIHDTPTAAPSGEDKKAPVMKVKEKDATQAPTTPTVFRNGTTSVLPHTPPGTTGKSEKLRKLNFSSDVKVSDGGSNSPRKRENFGDSPRRGNLTPRDKEKQSSNGSPVTTPRAKDEGKTIAQPNLSTGKFRKQVSRKFTEMKLNLSGLSEKLAASLNSPPSSPGSAGRVSPSKISPRKKAKDPLQDVPVPVRNQAAKSCLGLLADPVYAKADAKRKSILLNAKMMQILSDEKIAFDERLLQALAADIEMRTKNLIIDMDVDLTDSRYSDFCEQAADAAFMKPWKHDSSDIVDSDGNRMGDPTKARPTFIRDFRNSIYKIKKENGEIETVSSVDEFLRFFSSHENKNIGLIVSNIASQNLSLFLKNVLFRRQDKNGQSQSILRLSDGTPIQPLANFKATYTLSKDSKNNVIIHYEARCDSTTGKGGLRANKIQENPQNIAIADDASMIIQTRIVVGPDGHWSIDDPHVYAQFWNLEKEV